MPRRSLAALITSPVATRTPTPRLRVPVGLSTPEREVWTSTVATLPPDWFRGQEHLLEAFCRHVVRARCLEAMLTATDPATDLERYRKVSQLVGDETRVILALSRGMRLTAQSRVAPTTAYRRAQEAPPVRDVRILLESEHGNE